MNFYKPVFLFGKIKNKYIIVDILGFAFENSSEVCLALNRTSKSMRRLCKETYSYIKSSLLPPTLKSLVMISKCKIK